MTASEAHAYADAYVALVVVLAALIGLLIAQASLRWWPAVPRKPQPAKLRLVMSRRWLEEHTRPSSRIDYDGPRWTWPVESNKPTVH